MSWAGTACEISTIVAAGLIERITPFIAATYGLPVPKSVVRVMMGITDSPSESTPRTTPGSGSGLTLGFFFFAWPINCPRPLSLPSLTSATILGLAASSSRQRFSNSDSSTAAMPIACIVSSSDLPPASISANTSRAAAGGQAALADRVDQFGQLPGPHGKLLDARSAAR